MREAILTKVLVAAMPDRFFPLLTYDSEAGGKRQIADVLFGLELPSRDGTGWTIGRLAIWSNDLFVDIAKTLGYENLQTASELF